MIDETFGEWLKNQRKIRGWTQKELASRVNCSTSSIRKLEAENRRPSAQIVERLADVFGIPVNKRINFHRFARGDWQSAPQEDDGKPQLKVTEFISSSKLPRSIMSFIETEDVEDLIQLARESPKVGGKVALIHQALKQAEANGEARTQMECLWQLGWLDQENRYSLWNNALDLARVLGDSQSLASGLSMMGLFLVLNGDLTLAQRYLAESALLYQKLNLRPIKSHLLSAYGQISLIRGDFVKARFYLEEHARASLDIGNREDYLWSNVRLGYVALREGNLHDSRRIFEESVREFRKDKNIIGIVFALEGMADHYAQSGDLVRAIQLIGWADSVRRKISDTRPNLEQADVDKIISICHVSIGEKAFAAAYDKGQKMTTEEAVSYAFEKHLE